MKRLERQLCAAIRRSWSNEPPDIPEAGRMLWRMFADLSDGRTFGMAGPNPLSWTDIDAWARLRRWELSQGHLDILRAMDAEWLECAYSARSGPSKPNLADSPQALDAAFQARGWG